MDVLLRIQRLVASGAVRFTEKARDEMDAEGLAVHDVVEAILNAPRINKVLRSRSRARKNAGEKLYVIEGLNNRGTLLYTKGKITREAGREFYYLLISSKTGER